MQSKTDGRAYALILTEKGEAVVEQYWPIVQETENHLVQNISMPENTTYVITWRGEE